MCSLNKLPTKLRDSIKSIIEKERYMTYEIEVQALLLNGRSYLGELHEVDVKGVTKDGYKEINLFVKANNGSKNTKWLSVTDVYRKELLVYREIFEIFAELHEEANVPAQDRLKMVKSYEGSSTDAIIMENIAKKGFRPYSSMEVVSLQFAEMSIKELAKLHALSFVLQEQRPEYFDRCIKKEKYSIIFEEDWQGYVNSMLELTMKYVNENVKQQVENTYRKLGEKYAEYFKDETTTRCICHGDFRANNMMTIMNNGEVLDLVALDYQFLHYGCPVLDFLYFIFINTDQKLRKAHLSHLKDLYHNTMRIFLEYFYMDVDSVYSRKKFEEAYKEKLDYGLLVGYAILPLSVVSKEHAPDLTGELARLSFKVNEVEYRERQRGIIEDFMEWGYIL